MVLDGGGTPTTGTTHTTTFSSPSAGNTQISIDGFFSVAGPTADFNNLTVDGTTDPDSVVVDLTNANPLPHGMTYSGGGTPGSNSLTVQGGSITNLTYNATGVGAGNVVYDGTTIGFTQLSPVTVTSTVANVAINVTDSVSHKIALGAVSPPVAGSSQVTIDGGLEEMTFTNPTTSLSLTGTGHADTITLNQLGSGFAAPTINLTDGSGAEVDIAATPASSTTTVATNVATLTSPFLLYVGSTSATFHNGTGSLANILGNVQFNDLATSGSGQLYVDDSSDSSAKTIGVTSSQIAFSGGIGTIGYSGNQTNIVQVAAGTGGNTYNVTSTSSHATTTLFGGFGTGANTNTYNVSVPGLAGITSLVGEGIASNYNINFTGGSSLSGAANLSITGHTGGTSSHRDTVNLNAQTGGGGRTVGFNYQAGAASSSIQVTGLGGATPISATNIEQVDYNGAPAGDTLAVTGPTATTSAITVAPQSASSALVFLGATNNGAGSGWTGPPAGYTTTLPGIAGGSKAPDLFLTGSKTTGVTINGGAPNNDQLIVYAPSETQVLDAATTSNPFGFGVGVIVPGHAVGTVYNTITASDSGVNITDSTLGLLLPVKIGSAAAFVQTVNPLQTPGLIVNSGDQAGSQPSGIADNITATLSTNFKIQVNGGNPTAIPNSTNGDKLNVLTPAGTDIDVWNDASNPPNVTITDSAPGGPPNSPGIGFSSIENLSLSPGSGVVNVFGNNNNPATPQTDYVKVVGTGANAFQMQVGTSTGALPAPPANQILSAPINFTGVTTLNVYGGPNSPPAFADSDVNTLNITPWANNTPQNWGVQTFYNQGGTTTGDLLIWNGLAGVSEAITVQPSGPLEGQVYGINSASNTPVAIVNYTGNLGIIVQGTHSGLGEIDSLTLDGTAPANGTTSGTDKFLASFAADGTAGDPMVQVTDNVSSAQLYNLLYFSNISTINFATLGGADTVDITTLPSGVVLPDGTKLPTDGSFKINVDGGQPGAAAATLDVVGTINGNDTYTVTPGATTDSGTLNEQLAGAITPTTITFRRTRLISIAGSSVGNDTLIVNGNGNGDSFVVSPGAGPVQGVVQANGNVPVNFAGFTLGSSTVTLAGGNGNANFNITPIAGVNITAAGGGLATSNQATVNGTAVADTINVTPTAAGAATVQVNALGLVTISNTGALAINGQGGNDALTVTTPAGFANNDTYTPGATPDAGKFQVNSLVPISYSNLGATGSVTVSNSGPLDTLSVNGTSGNDTFRVAASGDINLNSQLVIHTPGVGALNLNGLLGTDVFNITGGAPFRGISLNGTGTANLTAPTGAVAVAMADPAVNPNTLISGYGPNVLLNGVGTANLDLTGGVALTANGHTLPNAFNYQPTSATGGTFTDADVATTFNFTNATSTFTIDGGASGSNQVSVQGTAGNDTITAVVGANPANTQVTVNALLPVQIVTAHAASLVVSGGTGNDNLTVNSATAPVTVPITYDGGAGTNALTFTGGTATSDVYSPGSQLGAGTNTLTFAGGTELVHFMNLAPVFDLVAGPLTVNGTNAVNAINYSVGFNNLANFLSVTPNTNWGQVAVDSYEPIEFINKTTLTINGLAGSDEVNLNNPNTPTALTSIAVNGGDPTASDTLVVNGTAAANSINVSPTATTTTITGAGPVTITANTVEQLIVNGQGGGDTLTVTTPAGANSDTYTPGAAFDSGNIQVGNLLPISYSGLGTGGGVAFANAGAADTLAVNGTAGNDTFTVAATTGAITLNSQLPISAPGIAALILNGLGGIDTFNITGALPANYKDVLVNAAGASGDDPLNVNGTAGVNNAIALNLQPTALGALGSVQQITGLGAPIGFQGVGTVNISGGSAGNTNTLTVATTTPTSDLTVTPTGANSGTFGNTDGSGPVFNFSNVTGNFTVNGAGTSNQLTVNATSNADTINVTPTQISVVGLKTVNYTGMAAVTANGLQGADTFNVTPSATTAIRVNGNDPIGVLPGDTLNIIPGGNPVTFFAGPLSDEGGFQVGANQAVSFTGIETIGPIMGGGGGGGPVLIVGTNGNDTFTVIARDSSYNPAADGIQDYTVSVDAGPNILFINAPTLYLDGLNGSDTFNVRMPAPNNASWNTNVFIAGGPSSNDQLLVQTIGTQNVTYNPTGAETGTFVMQQANPSTITLGQFTIPAIPYTSSTGGVEQFIYDGQAGNSSLTVNSPAGANNDVYTPGATPDSGVVAVGSTLPINFTNLGATAGVTLSNTGGTRVDTLSVTGTVGNDIFNVAATTGAITVNNHLTVATPGVNSLILNGQVGVDTFNIAAPSPYANILANSGANTGDPLNVTGTPGNDAIAVNLQPTLVLGNLVPTITGLGGTIGILGVDAVNIDGGGGTDTLTVNGTNNDDTIDYTPTGAAAGNFLSDGTGPLYSFTNITGAFTVNGGVGGSGIGNQVILHATTNNDTTIIDEPNRTATVFSAANAVTPLKPVILTTTVQQLTALGGLGNNSFLVIPAGRVPGPDIVVGAAGFSVPSNLLVNVVGGATGGGNTSLVVANYTPGAGGSLNPAGATPIQSAPGLADEFAVVNRTTTTSGIVRIFRNSGGTEPFQFPDITYSNVGTVQPLATTSAAGATNELVLGPDPNQPNGSISTATFLGSGSTINANNLALFPNAFEHTFVQADQSYYQVVAQQTGTLDFQVYFQLNPGMLPDSGQLNIQVVNAAGQVLGQSFSPTAFGAASSASAAAATGDRIRIPVISGQSYFLRVFGADNTVINGYKATIINTPAPVPYDIELSRSVPPPIAGNPDTGDLPPNAPANDTGRSQFDNVTNINNPTLYVHVDDAVFLQDLQANQANNTPPIGQIPIPFNTSTSLTPVGTGYRVAIYDDGGGHTVDPNDPTFLGFAQLVTSPAGYPHLYALNLASVLPAGQTLSDGIHNITAKVQMIDPVNTALTGFGSRSVAQAITIDTVVPPVQFGITSPSGTTTGLDGASDSGALGATDSFTLADRITNDHEPTFYGTAESNAIVKSSYDPIGQQRHCRSAALGSDDRHADRRHQCRSQRPVDDHLDRRPGRSQVLQLRRRASLVRHGRRSGRQRQHGRFWRRPQRTADHNLPRYAGSADCRSGHYRRSGLQPVRHQAEQCGPRPDAAGEQPDHYGHRQPEPRSG